MHVAVIALTEGGKKLCEKLCSKLSFDRVGTGSSGIKQTVKRVWAEYDGIIFIMATGIVVRAIAPKLVDKNTDPCVVVLDEGGNFAISLLSGHIGGGNALAKKVAEAVGATAVITTASDVLGLTAIDLWAKHNNLVASRADLTKLSSILVNKGRLQVTTDFAGTMPDDFSTVDDSQKADLLIAHQNKGAQDDTIILRPKTLVVGIGCNRNTDCREIESAVRATCEQNGLAFEAIDSLASIDLKKDEAGLLEFAKINKLPIKFYSADQLNSIEGINKSEAVFKATGAYGVSEPAALLQAESKYLIVEKTKWENVTVAIAAKTYKLSAKYSS